MLMPILTVSDVLFRMCCSNRLLDLVAHIAKKDASA